MRKIRKAVTKISALFFNNEFSSRFMINLACGSSDSSDLALHFDVRFKHGTDQNIVVRTSREKGKFGKEERQHSAFPFKRGEMFEMILMGELNCIKVIQ